MNFLECLKHPAPEGSELMFSSGLFNVVGVFLLLSVFFAVIFAPLVRRAYRARVQRIMGLNQVHPRPDGWWSAPANRDHSPQADSAPVTREARMADCLNWEKRVTRATVAAWVVFILIAPAMSAWSNPDAHWVSDLKFGVLAGLLAMGPAIVNLPLRWQRKSFFIGIGVLALMLFFVYIIGPETVEPLAESEEDDIPDWVAGLFGVFMAWVYVSAFRHRMRGQVIPLVVILVMFVLVFIFPLGLLEPYMGSCLTGPGEAILTSGNEPFLAGTRGLIGATLAMSALWVAFRALGLLATGVERGWLGDLSMVSLVGLTTVAISMLVAILPEEAAQVPGWVGWLPLLWVIPSLAIYVLLLGRRPLEGHVLPLLMLRVFSMDKKKQELLWRIQERWRYAGAVNQAGGPDLVDLNLDPYECSRFMSGSLHELFLPEAVNGERLMTRFEHAPDREGRYRINEMFNFNTSWRGNVEQLILNSPTILLDVRGLTAEREGTSFEIGLLAKHALLDRVVAVGDDETDWEHIGHRLAQHGQRLEDLKRCELAEDADLNQLFGELMAVATRGN